MGPLLALTLTAALLGAGLADPGPAPEAAALALAGDPVLVATDRLQTAALA